MATKGALWIWLTLLAIRGLTVSCFYFHYQRVSAALQQEELSKEVPASTPPPHHYKINQVHTTGISFFVLS